MNDPCTDLDLARVHERFLTAQQRWRLLRDPPRSAWFLYVGWDRRYLEMQNRTIIVTCGCGLAYTIDQLRTLDLIGFQKFAERFDPVVERLELRACICGSTHGVWVDRNGNHIIAERG